MWRKVVVVLLGLAGTVQQCLAASRRSNFEEGCPLEPACLHCGPNGCEKCPKLIVNPSRKCVNTCPLGYTESWSTMVDFMGRVCSHNGNFLGFSSNTLTILAGIVAGLSMCFVAFFIAILYVKFKRKHATFTSDTSSETDTDTPERKDFIKQLETLRFYSQCYLDMLNETRQQIRQLHQEGDNSAIAAYKPVVRDLAKILLLLNKPVENLSIPDDWEHLFNWAEKALKRYKRMSDSSQPQVAQLIHFLQSPIIPSDPDEPEYSVRGSTTMSTFKPDQPFGGSSLSLQSTLVKGYQEKYQNLSPEWKFEYSLVGNTSSEFNPMAWKNSKEFVSGSPLFLEDDFYKLGYRPQDEITTEL
ncbi:unnamed protein product [Ceutorhynchus assimilis]|uniref:Uncharacterized protein n=1 Tax=Ceutorhynchus assimilis TaxID=467358 RepID=A0A9N9MNM8_9CUCU|nr:unnamed protein product [Ceutorhynchus assimilis]